MLIEMGREASKGISKEYARAQHSSVERKHTACPNEAHEKKAAGKSQRTCQASPQLCGMCGCSKAANGI